MTHQDALNKAKIRLMSRKDSAFFTTVCFSLKHVWDDKIPTACTNGLDIRFNPDFFMGLNIEEQVGLLLHESMHVAYLHMERLQDREMMRWNIAADHVINLMLLERNFQLPKGALADRQYIGMGTEEVYKLIDPQEAKNTDVMLDLEPAPVESTELAKQVEEILVRASIQSKMANDKPGTIPGDIQIFLNGLLNPKLPWHVILRRFFNALTKNDYSWRRPNRRFFPQHYLPSLYSDRLMNIAIAVDSSGSVSDEEFHQFVSETHTILKTLNPEKISLIQFDSSIRSVDEVKGIKELMRLNFKGRGGTEIEPVLQWAKENKPGALLIFSDGYFNFYDNDNNPGMPIIWLIHDRKDFIAPFGKVINYDM